MAKDKIIPVAQPSLGEKEMEYVSECLRSGWVSSLGKYIPMFEEKFSEYCGTKYGVATSNGTAALHLALETLAIGPGDEVIIPTLTFVATANAVTYTGAKPILVDAEFETWNIDPIRIEEKITPRTKAIIPVHLYGHPADMEPILKIASRHKLYVIEDAAEAPGAKYKDRMVGSLGDISCFSFYGNKTITTGEGGLFLTDRLEWAERARLLRDHAMSKQNRYWHEHVGFNYRMTNVQAAIGVAQMERIDEFVAKKRQLARWYSERLSNLPGITLSPEQSWATSSFWMYSIVIDENTYGISRNELADHLHENGIDSRPFFWPIHMLPPYRSPEPFVVSEQLADQGMNLPSAVTLSEDDVDYVAAIIGSRE